MYEPFMLGDLIVENYHADSKQKYKLTNKRLQKLMFFAYIEGINIGEPISTIFNNLKWVAWKEHGPVAIVTYYAYTVSSNQEITPAYYSKDNNKENFRNPLYNYTEFYAKVLKLLDTTRNITTDELIKKSTIGTPWEKSCKAAKVPTIPKKDFLQFYYNTENYKNLYQFESTCSNQFSK